MDLFEQLEVEGQPRNLLPYDGRVNYYGPILSNNKASFYYDALLEEIAWKNDRALIFGKDIVTKRKVAWYADKPFLYTYSQVTKKALPWTESLLELKQIVERKSESSYNACLLNLYHSGQEGMAWHSDAEKELKRDGAIASVSLGAERVFSFKHKTDSTKVKQLLEHGSLLVMKDNTQSNWLHSLPITKRVTTPRINLTFRSICTSV